MTREIKFRGQTIKGEWVHGLLCKPLAGKYKGMVFISNRVGMPIAYEIQPETVGMYTTLLDKNGKEIYEGDIVKCQQGCAHEVVYVMDIGGEYWGGMPGFALDGLLRNGGKGYAWTGEEEIIGNKYQNHELLENN